MKTARNLKNDRIYEKFVGNKCNNVFFIETSSYSKFIENDLRDMIHEISCV
jgi:hypothetical protein